MENKKNKLLPPKYDIVFQTLFGENKEKITEDFISEILGEKIEIIDIQSDSTLVKKYPLDKSGRLDLKTKFKDGTICQIEMQLANEKFFIERFLYYWSKTYSSQIKRGENYKNLVKTIGIVIADFELKELKGLDCLDISWKIMSSKRYRKVLTNKMELYILEIPKALKLLKKEKDNKVAQWLMFLDNPNKEGMEKVMDKNEGVKKAKSILHTMSEDEELRRLAVLKEKAMLDENNRREQWLEDGLAKGRKEGIKEGIKEGMKAGKKEVAKKMKKLQINIENIIEITGLTKEEIEKL